MLKRDFVRRLNMAIIISITLFIIFIGAYFYLSFQTQVSAIRVSVDIVQETFTNLNILTSLRNNLSQANFLFTAQLITFIVAMIALLSAIWYTTHRYLVEKKNALIDSLTQIYNRKAFFFALTQELKKTERFAHPTTVAILDLDHFKVYNDRNGHLAGDNLLRRFARILKETVRKYDIIGRYGGEEFVILFPETNVNDSYQVCERIRQTIEKTKFYGLHKMPNKKMTISIGLAEVKGKKKVYRDTIMHKADKFLYKAKEAGRNQVLYK